MNTSTLSHEDAGRLLLRLGLGAMWLSHGLVLTLIVAEILGGTLILLGFHGRIVSALLLPILLGAIWVHSGNGWVFTSANGGWEYPAFLALASVVHVALGDGAYALSRRKVAPVQVAHARAA